MLFVVITFEAAPWRFYTLKMMLFLNHYADLLSYNRANGSPYIDTVHLAGTLLQELPLFLTLHTPISASHALL